MPQTKARFTVVWLGGPRDGATTTYEGTAPRWLTYEVRPGSSAIHRYKRGTNVGGPENAPIWIYEHEGSVVV